MIQKLWYFIALNCSFIFIFSKCSYTHHNEKNENNRKQHYGDITLHNTTPKWNLIKYFSHPLDFDQAAKLNYQSGIESYEKSDFLNALNYWQKAYLFYTKSGNLRNQGRTLVHIANVYFQIQDAELYKEYTKKAMSYFLELQDTTNIAVCYMNLGNYDHTQGDFESALLKYKKALKSFWTDDQIRNRLTCIGNIGAMYNDLHQFELGRQYLEEAEIIAKSLNDIEFLSRNSYNLAFIFYEEKDYLSCIQLLEQSIAYGKTAENYYYLSLAYKKLADCYAELNDINLAYDFITLHNQYKDSVFSIEKSNQINIAEIKFKNQLDKSRIELLELEKTQNELIILKARDKSNLLTLILILFVLIGLILFLAVVFWLKNNQKHAMITQKQLLQRKHMDALIKSQEEERKKLARDLHDSVGQKLMGLLFKTNEAMNLMEKKAEDKEKLETIKNLAEDCYAEVRTISHQMMPRAIQESTLTEILDDLLRSTFNGTSINYFLHSNILEDFEDKIKLNVYRICQELINNILKHAKKCKEIHISLIKSNSLLVIVIEDDGKNTDISTIYKSINGIGIQNINARLDLIDGTIFYELGDAGGLRSTIRINL